MMALLMWKCYAFSLFCLNIEGWNLFLLNCNPIQQNGDITHVYDDDDIHTHTMEPLQMGNCAETNAIIPFESHKVG